MIEFVENITLGEVALLVAVLGALTAVLRKVVPAVRKAARLIDDVMGVEESVPGRGDGQPGVMDRIAHLETRVAQIADTTAATVVQVHPNGGGSMRDQIDALTQGLTDLSTLIQERLPEHPNNNGEGHHDDFKNP